MENNPFKQFPNDIGGVMAMLKELEDNQDMAMEWVNQLLEIDLSKIRTGRLFEYVHYYSPLKNLFTTFYNNIEKLKKIKWESRVQYIEIMTRYTKFFTKIIQQYCDSLNEYAVSRENYPFTDIDPRFCINLLYIKMALNNIENIKIHLKDISNFKSSSIERIADGTFKDVISLNIYNNNNENYYKLLKPKSYTKFNSANDVYDGNKKDISYLYFKTKKKLNNTEKNIINSIVCSIIPTVYEILKSTCNENEAISLNEKHLNQSTVFSVDNEFTNDEVEEILCPLTLYLSRNLEILNKYLYSNLVEDIAYSMWCEILNQFKKLMTSPNQSEFESKRHFFNQRQLSFIKHD